jgi:hypothetical protein
LSCFRATVTSHRSQDAAPTQKRLLLNSRKSFVLFGPRLAAPNRKKATARASNPIPTHFNIRRAAFGDNPDVLSGAMLLMPDLFFS